MPTPSVYLDACVHHGLVRVLRAQGFIVTSSVDVGTTDYDDEAQLRYAVAQDLMIITHNEKHFRPLHEQFRARGEEHSGILVLPATPPLERLAIRASMLLRWIETLPEYRSRLFKWGNLQELLEGGRRLPEYDEEAVKLALGR
jgi:hypothetical protein